MTKLTPVEKVSSLDAIINSIQAETQICRWFALLIEQPGIREKLLKKNKAVSILYSKLNYAHSALAVFNFLTILGGILILAFGEYQYVPIFLFLGYGIFLFGKKRKNLVAQISQELLAEDFPGDTITTKSLYQITEIYSREQAIPSLIDTFSYWDRFMQIGIIGAYLACTLVFPIKLWKYALVIPLVMFTIQSLIQLKVIYRRLK